MDISIDLKGIVSMDYPGQGIEDVVSAGFMDVTLDMALGCHKKQVLVDPALLSVYMEPLLSRCGVAGLRHTVGLVPGHSAIAGVLSRLADTAGAADCQPGDTDAWEILELQQKLAEESVNICGKSGFLSLIIEPLSVEILDTGLWELNREFYLRLAGHAKKFGMMLLLVNQYRDRNGHLVRGICSDSRQAAEWIDRLNEEAGGQQFGFCMDAGVCNLCGQDMYDFCTVLGSRLKAVILRDNDGHKDSFLLPFTCASGGQSQTDWLNLIRGLRQIEFDGNLMLKLSDTAAAFSPVLRPELLRLVKSVADYMKWQIEMERLLKKYRSRVLFGAGNMCRNYMKCYGEQYPPLFTCDNQSALWGTFFCGLEVKAPEALKDLPPDCAIFICNSYYREIERQLKELGISNRIEYFNDEFMPAFYFNRLEHVDGRDKFSGTI